MQRPNRPTPAPITLPPTEALPTPSAPATAPRPRPTATLPPTEDLPPTEALPPTRALPAPSAPVIAPRPRSAAAPRPASAACAIALLLTACADPQDDHLALDGAIDVMHDGIDHGADATLDGTADISSDGIFDSMPDGTVDIIPDGTLDTLSDGTADTMPDASVDAMPDTPDATPDACPDPPGARCNPIPVDTFPALLHGDTTAAPEARIDAYTCAPATDERGGEVWHAIDLQAPALLTARLDDQPGDATDIDLHLLTDPDPAPLADCFARANVTLTRHLPPGRWYLVLDTWTGADGRPRAGAYTLTLELTPLDGPCAYDPRPLRMVWPDCDPTLDCYRDADATWLRTPAHGPVVKEAHLVTDAEAFPQGWPIAARDAIDRHYAISEATTAYAMPRREPWAPAGEGGSQWGQSAHARPLPVLDEAWYVNQYWRQRPPPGTRMIVYNPQNGRAVVAAGGYETGPGANTAIAGASEETHHHLGTTHRDPLLVGFAADQALPLGPIDCGW